MATIGLRVHSLAIGPRLRARSKHLKTSPQPSLRPGALRRWLTGLALTATVAIAQAQIGMSQLQLEGLPVTLVYPSAQATQARSFGPFELQVAIDAVPSTGPRRLIVLSHGTGGSPLSDHTLAATLARAGYVVAQPLHAGDNFQDTSRAGPEAWISRPSEVTRVIDGLARHPTWQPLLQLDRVGVHGMSAGGVTALSLAGAQWRMLDLVRHCLAHTEADFGFCFNGVADTDRQAQRRAGYERARGVPEAFLPATMTAVHGGHDPAAGDVRPDPRVAAVTLAVPVAAIYSTESLARIRVPVGLVSAARDRMLLPRFHSGHVLQSCSRCTLLADLTGAAHMDLLSPWPESVARATAALHPRGSEPEPGFDPAARQAAFDAIAVFYRRHLTLTP